MKLGVVMACLWIGMVTSTRSTFHCCIFLKLICDAVVPVFLVFWGFVYDFLGGTTSKWIFFLGLPSESPKIRTFVLPKLWMLISSSNQTYLNHVKIISCSLQKYLSNGVSHSPIGDHLIFVVKGFVVKN
jgi:hypothetical protein